MSMGSRDLRALRRAGAELLDVIDALQRKGRNVVTELLGGRSMTEWDHYPADDAFDVATGYRWYYHTHVDTSRGDEHGHFHLFAAAKPAPGEAPCAHLVAFGVGADGLPRRAFTTNRWVTNEAYRPAGQVLRRLQRFALHKPAALALVHRWLAALVGVFRPQLSALLVERDRRIEIALRKRPGLFEDRRTSLLSQCRLDLQHQIAWIDQALATASGAVR